MATEELAKIGIIEPGAVRDGTVIRMPKAYPAYFGTYDRFEELRAWIDRFENLFLIGRNGMHRYNNMDHSMLTAMVAVDNLVAGRTDPANVWSVNAEQEYHETRAERPPRTTTSPASGSGSAESSAPQEAVPRNVPLEKEATVEESRQAAAP